MSLDTLTLPVNMVDFANIVHFWTPEKCHQLIDWSCEGITILHLAATYDRVDICSSTLQFYNESHPEEGSLHAFVNSRDSEGSSALVYAVFYENEAIMKLQLQNVAEVSLRDSADFHENAFVCAVEHSRPAMLAHLLTNCPAQWTGKWMSES